MKTIYNLALASTLAFASLNAQAAGFCGAGKITSIKEGGWASNDFMIKIDYSVDPQSSMAYSNQGHIRFKATLDEKRFTGIKALAYMAFSSNRTVRIYTSTDCASAVDITVYAPGYNF